MNIIIAVLGVVFLLDLCGSSRPDASLKIEPRSLFVLLPTTTEATVTCVLQDTYGRKLPLAGCQFKVKGNEHIYEFNKGVSSPLSTGGLKPGRYIGNGLNYGDCGINLSGITDFNHHIVGCRVRPAVVNSSWIYETMMIFAAPTPPMQFHLQPQETVATAGSDVTFNGAAEQELSWCFFWLSPSKNNTISLMFNAGHASAKHSLGRYEGAGLEHKECGVTLLNVEPKRSGFVIGFVYSTPPVRASMDFAKYIVLTAPEAPLLTVNTTGLLAPGDILHATCVVKNSRPVANLTWILGDEVIREDNINEAPLDSKWCWNYELQTIEQNLKHVVTLSDNGKRLKCKASHVALSSGSQDSTSHVVRVFRG